MKKYFLLIACLVSLCVSQVSANDSSYEAIGNTLVPLQETSIEVTSEVLKIDLRNDKTAFVDVYYVFTNPEKTPKKVLMGFEAYPPYPGGIDLHNNMPHPSIKNFKVEMNGKMLDYNNAICDAKEAAPFKPMDVEGWGYLMGERMKEIDGDFVSETFYFAFVYYFEATFKPGKNIVHHTYSYELGTSTVYLYTLDYLLKPATRWANKQIDDFTLIISANNTAKHFYINADCLPLDITPTILKGAGKFRKRKGEEAGYFVLGDDIWEIALRNASICFRAKNYRPERNLHLLGACLIGKMGETYDREYMHVSLLGEPDDERALRIIHNLPYASRGRIFKDNGLQQFFDSCWWYMPDPKYHDETDDFTSIDWEYVKNGK